MMKIMLMTLLIIYINLLVRNLQYKLYLMKITLEMY